MGYSSVIYFSVLIQAKSTYLPVRKVNYTLFPSPNLLFLIVFLKIFIYKKWRTAVAASKHTFPDLTLSFANTVLTVTHCTVARLQDGRLENRGYSPSSGKILLFPRKFPHQTACTDNTISYPTGNTGSFPGA